MTATTLAGTIVELDEDGHFLRPEQWREDMAGEIAAGAGIMPLTEEHWRVVRFMRGLYLDGKRPPSCRMTCKQCGISGRQLFRLFPRRPVTLAAKVAGVPAPHTYIGGCGVNALSRWR